MSVALFNLVPLLPLDGGNIAISLIEGLRRRPVPPAVYQRLSMLGTLLILVITAIALSNDIGPSPH
jgi:regulator of sigma E protease